MQLTFKNFCLLLLNLLKQMWKTHNSIVAINSSLTERIFKYLNIKLVLMMRNTDLQIHKYKILYNQM